MTTSMNTIRLTLPIHLDSRPYHCSLFAPLDFHITAHGPPGSSLPTSFHSLIMTTYWSHTLTSSPPPPTLQATSSLLHWLYDTESLTARSRSLSNQNAPYSQAAVTVASIPLNPSVNTSTTKDDICRHGFQDGPGCPIPLQCTVRTDGV